MEVLKEHNITAHDQLFQDATRRRLRRDEYATWYPEEITFQPVVNKRRVRSTSPGDEDPLSRASDSAQDTDKPVSPPPDVSERLYKLSKEQSLKLEKMRSKVRSSDFFFKIK